MITGNRQVGQTLTCTTGTWTNTPTSYAHQWRRNSVSIPGATGSTYLVVAADAAANINCAVVASNAVGASGVVFSNTLSIDGIATNTVAPVVSGTATVGSTLSCTTGGWTYSPTSYAYQWRRNGTNIGGAVGSTYLLVSADGGASITCAVTATNPQGASLPAISNALTVSGGVTSGGGTAAGTGLATATGHRVVRVTGTAGGIGTATAYTTGATLGGGRGHRAAASAPRAASALATPTTTGPLGLLFLMMGARVSLTAAMTEAYAANPAGVSVIETIELNHVTFAEPVRIATGVQEDISLPLTLGGAAALFRALQISVTLPGVSEDGPTPMRLRIDNVSSFLLPYIRDAVQSTEPIALTYRAYASDDLTQPGDVVTAMELRDVSLSAVSAEATVALKEIELQAFPLATYDEDLYPALQNTG